MRERLAWIEDALKRLDEQSLRRSLQTRADPQAARITLAGRSLLNFGSNDYLGLAADPRLIRAAQLDTAAEGAGSGASPLIVGRGPAVDSLERALAEFKQTPAALVFTSGFAANLATIAALVERGDAVFSDELNHASIVDGCRLSRAEVYIYRHRDIDHLKTLLAAAGSAFRRRLIVTDTLFSMDGDIAPLADLAAVADENRCMLMVDEAHATGVFGERGTGLVEALGVEDGVDVRLGTLSKALGSAGGFVCGEQSLIDWLVNRGRSYIFSTAPPASVCAAAKAALHVVHDEPERRVRLLQQAEQLRTLLRSNGWQCGDSASQIVPLIVGAADRALGLADHLRAAGIYAPPIRPPSVSAGHSMVRISLSAAHDDAAIEALVEALGRAES